MQKILFGLALLLLSLFWFLMLNIILPYSEGATDIDFLLSKQHIIYKNHYKWSFFLHIFSSLWLLGAGLTQFSAFILHKKPVIHRWTGRIYVFIIIFISAPAALVMSLYANGGAIAIVSFTILSILWWYFTLISYLAMRKGDIKTHAAFMIRGYALTLSAITLRLMQVFLASFTNLDSEFSYTLIAFPSWLLNLGIAEYIIRRTKWFAFYFP